MRDRNLHPEFLRGKIRDLSKVVHLLSYRLKWPSHCETHIAEFTLQPRGKGRVLFKLCDVSASTDRYNTIHHTGHQVRYRTRYYQTTHQAPQQRPNNTDNPTPRNTPPPTCINRTTTQNTDCRRRWPKVRRVTASRVLRSGPRCLSCKQLVHELNCCMVGSLKNMTKK